MNNFGEKVSFIWSVADLLRGPYRPNQYKDIMLPLTVLRRLDCVLEPTKDAVLKRMEELEGGKVKNIEPMLFRVTGVPFYNTSRYTFEKLKGDPNNIAANLTHYIKGFSTRAREIIEHFGFEEHIAFGDNFTDDSFPRHTFDYMLANPPFGVEWKPEEDAIRREHDEQGFGGRFGAGLPPIDDGAILFLQHMVSKMKDPAEGGTRLAIVFNGSPLFSEGPPATNSKDRTGNTSSIRQWIIENDWLEAIVALPDQLFYNTGIYTYLWIVTNRKEPARRGKIQLVDATSFFKKMRKSLGNKRHEICEDQRDDITRLYGQLTDGEQVRIFDNSDFGYQRITVERPLRLNFAVDDERLARVQEARAFANLATSKKRKDAEAAQAEIEAGRQQQEAILTPLRTLAGQDVVKDRETFATQVKAAFKHAGVKVPSALFKAILMALAERDETAEICTDAKGNPEPDPQLRDYENVPLKEDIHDYMRREVLPHVPDAWVDESKTKIGYEINFNRHFYQYTPPRPLEEIENDLKQIEAEIAEMLEEVTE